MHVRGAASHGFLAVDFFFVLSGFVVASAYEPRFSQGMKLRDFARVRFVRLFPLMFVGAIAAAALTVARDQAVTFSALTLLGQILLIPGLAGAQTLFVLNAPYWSLLFEVLANACHALCFRWASTRLILLGVALAGVAVALTAMKMSTLGGGWSPHNAWVGFIRVGFSYPLGVLIYRLHNDGRLPNVRLPFGLISVMLVAAIVGASYASHWAADAFTVIVVFPTLLVLGIGADTGRLTGAAALLGGISFPLYVLHDPIVQLWARYAPHQSVSAVLIFATCVLVAIVAERFVEEPGRRWLGGVLRGRPRSSPVV